MNKLIGSSKKDIGKDIVNSNINKTLNLIKAKIGFLFKSKNHDIVGIFVSFITQTKLMLNIFR